MTTFSPREIVSELDRYIIGQNDAKRAVAIALRNRWRRQQLTGTMKEEVLPKNILMIGPTGIGKTEISRRLAKLAGAPFLKIEATKFTEVGYVGRDVEQIVRDLVEVGIGLVRERKRKEVAAKAEQSAEERVLTALVGESSSPATRESFRKKLREGELADKEIEIEVRDTAGKMPSFDIPGMPGASVGVMNISDMLGKAFGNRTKKRKVTVGDSYDILIAEESDRLLDDDEVVAEAIESIASSVTSSVTPSVAISAMYCLIRLASGSVRIRRKSFFVKGCSSTRIGNLPCSSGRRSEGLATWKAPEAMKRMWSVFTGPCLVATVVPSISGRRSRCTPSRLTSPP